MKTITVCVGSACHMKGSHHVIDEFDELIQRYGLQDVVELKASFCMDQCTGNIGARIDDRQIFDLTKDKVKQVFEREILGNQ